MNNAPVPSFSTDNNAHARTILQNTAYVVVGTADPTGSPWITPLWFAPDGLDRLYWVSSPGSRHSVLIEQRPEVALTVFDSTAVPNQGTAFYATARARQCRDDELDQSLQKLNRRTLEQAIGPFTRQHTTGQSRPRLYVAEIIEAWVLDQDADVDQRVTVPR